jgi:hypothetical protein
MDAGSGKELRDGRPQINVSKSGIGRTFVFIPENERMHS